MKYVFGPVLRGVLAAHSELIRFRSRRATGTAVIDSWDARLLFAHQRREYFPTQEIIAETQAALASFRPGQVDWVPFAGPGEPTPGHGISP